MVTFFSFMVNKKRQLNSSHLYTFNDFSCFALINPLLLLTLSINFLSFAGIPPLPGFFTKFLVLLSLMELEYFKLIFFIVVISIVSAYYYIRPIKIMFFPILVKPKFTVEMRLLVVYLIIFFLLFNLSFIFNMDILINLQGSIEDLVGQVLPLYNSTVNNIT